MNLRMIPFPWLVITTLALTACSGASDSVAGASTEAPAVDEGHAAASTPVPGGPELIVDPQFELAGDHGTLKHWKLYQHAGDASFSMEIQHGQAFLKRIGVEPWGAIEHTLPADELVGKTLEWSAELSGELGESRGEAFDASGLSVSIMGLGPNDLPMMGARHLLTLASDPPLSAGPVEPRRYSVRFVVPEGRDLELKVALQLTRDGDLRMRAPSLRVIESAPQPQ